jgi:carbamoyltransferase
LTNVGYIIFYDKPLVKFDRLLETYLAYAPKGFRSFVSAMPAWSKDKLFLKANLSQANLKGTNLKNTKGWF